MRIIRLLFVALLLPVLAGAQGINIKEGTIKMGKTKLQGFTATYQHPKNLVTDNMEKNIADAHLKRSSRKKGFSIYRGAAWTAISANKADYYYKVKSKKGQTMLSFAVSKGYDNYVTSVNDATLAANITRYLQNLDAQIVTNEQIKTKEGELKQIQQNNDALNKQLSESQKEQKKKNSELNTLKKQPVLFDK